MKKILENLFIYVYDFFLYLRLSWKSKLVAITLLVTTFKLCVWAGDGMTFIFMIPICILLFLIPDDTFKQIKDES